MSSVAPPVEAALSAWCEPGSDGVAIDRAAPLKLAAELFRDDPGLRILPVTGSDGRTVGAVFEEDMRRLLFNPFGHALLENPAFGRSLERYLAPCPTVASDASLATLLDAHASGGGREGIILTDGGRPVGVILNAALVRLAALHEARRGQAQTERLDRLTESCARFEREGAGLAGALMSAADSMRRGAADGVARARRTTERASGIAEAVRRGGQEIEALADQSRAVADALVVLHDTSAETRASVVEAVAASNDAAARAAGLTGATRTIDKMLALITVLARRLNLIALNATIEAARAGEAGRSFAVVASEVKGLASQTRLAAAEIGGQVTGIMAAMDGVTGAHQAVTRVIGSVEALAGSVANAVSIQRAASGEVASRAGAATEDGAAMASLVDEANRDARDAADEAGAMQGVADELLRQIGRLRNSVDGFVQEARAA